MLVKLILMVSKYYELMAILSRKSSPRAFSAQPSKSGLFVAFSHPG